MRYLSLFSGLGGAEIAFAPLGWESVGVSEIDPAACAVLAHHYPDVPNLGNVDSIKSGEWRGKVDLLIGGCPCQSFSVAGLRKSLGDARGNLTLKYVELTHAIDPQWTVFENVPGILSTKDNAFGCFLGGMVGSDTELVPARGQRWTDSGVVTGPKRTAAWRILDAQYMGVAQRRRRIFVLTVRGARNWSCAAALLPLADCLQRHPPSRKEKGERVAGCLKGGSGSRGWSDPSDGNGGGMVEVSGTLGRGYGDRGRDIDGAGESVPFTTSSHGSYDEGIGTLRSNGGDIGGGSETIIAHAVTCHHAKGGDPTTDNYLVTGGFFDSPIGTMACNTGPNGHDAGNFQSNQGVDSGYVIPVAYGFSGESDGSTVRNASDMARTITNRHGDPGFVAIQNATRGQDQNGLGISEDGTMYTLDQGSQHAVAWNIQDQNTGKSIKAKPSEISTCLGTRDLSKYQGTFNADVIQSVMQVRRLTPVECSRLQGVPDLYLDITYRGKPLADGLKYKLLGNGFAVPVVKYIGTRIQLVEDLINGIS